MNAKIKRQGALWKRILAWQRNNLLRKPAALSPGLAAPPAFSGLAQRPEQIRPGSGKAPQDLPACAALTGLQASSGPQVSFRAGQTWRRADLSAQFVIDFADAEQVEIRWLRQRQRGTTKILSASELFFYVQANNLRADWAPDRFLK